MVYANNRRLLGFKLVITVSQDQIKGGALSSTSKSGHFLGFFFTREIKTHTNNFLHIFKDMFELQKKAFFQELK